MLLRGIKENSWYRTLFFCACTKKQQQLRMAQLVSDCSAPNTSCSFTNLTLTPPAHLHLTEMSTLSCSWNTEKIAGTRNGHWEMMDSGACILVILPSKATHNVSVYIYIYLLYILYINKTNFIYKVYINIHTYTHIYKFIYIIKYIYS